jgi:hypothetical protein
MSRRIDKHDMSHPPRPQRKIIGLTNQAPTQKKKLMFPNWQQAVVLTATGVLVLRPLTSIQPDLTERNRYDLAF